MIRLDDFTGTHKVKVGSECKRLDNWAFVSDTYGRTVDEGKVVLFFKDGTREKIKSLDEIENCGR